MGKSRLGFLFMCVVAVSALPFALYHWLTELRVNWYALFVCSIALYFIFKYLTWDNVDELSEEEGQNELEKHVLKTSASITYYVLVVLIFGLFFATVGFEKWIDFQNIPLLFALCAAIVVKPAVEFLVVKRYR
ncbi:hypothetical protein [Bacillus cereus]|uniref:hypothetical protein n=1 Tax=Bacillus TaxID=1386 RepID=UPI003B67B54B